MLASLNSTAAKKDLHVGGIGSNFSSVIDPLMDASENWVRKARDFVDSADDFVRNNPWQAVGLMAMAGITLGYFLSRRARASDTSSDWPEDDYAG